MRIRYVGQEEPYGCGVACMAMLMGCTYAEARERYVALYGLRRPDQFVGVGICDYEVDTVLAAHGLTTGRTWRWVAEKRGMPWPPAPWAPAHLVQVVLPAGAHFVVMLADGTVLDPAQATPRRISEYADVMVVAAIALADIRQAA